MLVGCLENWVAKMVAHKFTVDLNKPLVFQGFGLGKHLSLGLEILFNHYHIRSLILKNISIMLGDMNAF
ncbi:hypothetical protein EPI10_003855 [Gossypium australe]|uniref:Uncharacterized protein n=1 Tax=Gossypium australe TaxID=47621 RepID=A0A5B6UGN5_9ROSI|nr:hypothetical protein EPI10_003855 [Gossypium australe]